MLVRTTSLSGMMYGAEADKILSIVGALAPVLEHPMFRIERNVVSYIEP
jgi:hypothetical protein